MKKLFLSIVTIITLFLFSFEVSNENVEKVLVSGKWFVESTQEKGKEPEKSEDKNDEWLLFHTDGKLEENQFGDISTRKWRFLKKNNTIEKIEDDNPVQYLKVVEISDTKLIVEQSDIDDSNNVLMITYVK